MGKKERRENEEAGIPEVRTRTTAQATAEGLRIFASSLPWAATAEQLKKDFEECGFVEDLFLLKDQEGKSRGKCFVTYRDQKAATAALLWNDTDYGGRKIIVKVAEGKAAGKSTDESKPAGGKPVGVQTDKKEKPLEKPEGCTSLCLKNTGEATEDDLWSFFVGCQVQAVRIVYDRVTGLSRGKAFVDFKSSSEIDLAMLRSGKELKGEPIEMCYEAAKLRPRPKGCFGIVIKKLSLDATEADVRQFLHGLDSLLEVRVVEKGPANLAMAFADFSKGDDVERAAMRSGAKISGQDVFVGYETKNLWDEDEEAAGGDEELLSRNDRKKRNREETAAENKALEDKAAQGQNAIEEKVSRKQKVIPTKEVKAEPTYPREAKADTASPKQVRATNAASKDTDVSSKKRKREEEQEYEEEADGDEHGGAGGGQQKARGKKKNKNKKIRKVTDADLRRKQRKVEAAAG